MAIIAGSETIVNTHMVGSQSEPEITVLTGGGWIVTWEGRDQDGSGTGVYQQAFGADGIALGDEVQVNTYTTSDQYKQTVTALDDGGWVVAWLSSGQDGNYLGVYQQAFNADGSVRGGETLVNSLTGGLNWDIRVTALEGGRWVTTWTSPTLDGDETAIGQRVFNSNGVAPHAETPVNVFSQGSQSTPEVIALDDGGWVTTWLSPGQDGDDFGVYQTIFNEDGTVRKAEACVNTFTSYGQTAQHLTKLADGGWVVTWQSDGQDGSGTGIYQQAYFSDGVARGDETVVNTTTESYQYNEDITALAGGGWVVVWKSIPTDGDGYGVYQQAFDANGTAFGGEMLVNATTANDQIDPKITALTGGGWVVTWTSGSSSYDLYQQVFNADGSRNGGETIINSYTSYSQTNQRVEALADGGWIVSWQSTLADGSDWAVCQRVFHIGNSAPTVENAIADQGATEDQVFSFQFASNVFADAESDTLTYTATLAGGGELPDWLSFDADTRTFSGTPANGDVATISVEVTADDGEFETSETFDITVAGVNDAPLGADKTVTIAEDTSYTFGIADFGFVDDEGDDLSAVVIATLPLLGTLTLDGVAVTAGQAIAASELGDLAWTPPKDGNGDGLAGFTFRVRDDGGTGNGGVDTDPVANSFTFDVTEVVDRFIGNAKANKLSGTAGQDYFRGKGGDDTLAGKAGADTFDFRTGDGHDTIKDFTATGADHDVVDLSGLGAVKNWKDLSHDHMEKHGHDVVIEGTGGDAIVLLGVKLGDLDKTDFAF
jgi:hypothetical protein